MDFEVVVTGAAGFIGSHQVEYLLKKGYSVVGIDNFHPYYSEKIKRYNLEQVRKTADNVEADFRFVEGSILDSDSLERLPGEPEKVFHLAALAGTRSSLNNSSEYFEVNVHGTSKLIEYFDNIGKFVFVSSSSVYGEVPVEELPVDEEYTCSPKTPYSLSKHSAEKLVELYAEMHDFDFAVVRPFTVFGPRQRPDEVFTKFLSNSLQGKPVEIYGDGTQSRDFTFVGDAVRGIYLAGEKGSGIYNIGSDRRVTVNQVVEGIDESIDTDVDARNTDKHPGDVSHTHADISKAREELDYNPETGMEEGISRCVEWMKKKPVREMISNGEFGEDKLPDEKQTNN